MIKPFFSCPLASILPTSVSVAEAQSPTSNSSAIGVFMPDTASAYAQYVATFVQSLRELGYVEHQNFIPGTDMRMENVRGFLSWQRS